MPTVMNEALPGVLVAIVLLLVLSASMSTLAGLIMVSASSISVDLVKGEIKKDMSKRDTVLLMRILVIVFVILSVVIAQEKWQLHPQGSSGPHRVARAPICRGAVRAASLRREYALL